MEQIMFRIRSFLGGIFVIAIMGCGGSHIPPDISANMASALSIREQLAVAGGGSAAEDVVLAEPTGFATLRGTFKLNGPAPDNPTLAVTKDLNVCMPSGTPVKDQIVTVGANGGLANVLIFADAVPDQWCHETMIGSSDTVEFDQKACLFLNRIFPMQTTQTLRILNSDPVGHNAAMNPGKNLPYNPNIAGGGSATYPPGGGELKEEKSPFSVACAAHPWMKSHMIFRKNGYFAVTGEDGTFEIPNLPAGVDVKLVVWHEATRFVPGKEVSAGDLAQGWNKRGAFTVNLPADSDNDLQVSVNSSAFN